MALFFLFAALTVCSLAQTSPFQCDFKMRAPAMTSGFVNGAMLYSYADHFIKLTFTTSSTSELYSFNTGNGFTNFDAQYKYVSAPGCSCSVAPLAAGQPVLFPSTTQLTAGTGGVYTPSNAASALQSVTFDSSNYPATATWTDGRSFTFSNCRPYTPLAADYTPPSGCSCGKPIDVVLVLDRSSSISTSSFTLEKEFTQNLVASFTYGPLAVNLGITNFHTLTWDGPVTLAQGTSSASVTAGASALQCYNLPQCVVYGSTVPAGSCCGSGTSISAGIVNGADMLATANNNGVRASAAKVIIVLTDGYHNKVLKKDASGNLIRDGSGKPQGIPYTVVSGGKTITCNEDPTQVDCVAGLLSDIQWAVAYAKQRVPTVSILSVGVGALWDKNQLLAIADNKPASVFGTHDWNLLTSLVDDLVLQTCQQSPENPNCVGCCGFCGCSGCLAPDGCDPAVNFCDTVNLQGTCCTTSPKPDSACANPSNLCNLYSCDRTLSNGQGACTSKAKPVTANTTCAGYSCNPITGNITYTDLCPPKCYVDSDCNDNNACTIDKCVIPTSDPHSAYCSTTPRNCTAEGTDLCSTYSCVPASGCTSALKPLPANTTCAAYNCDPATGLANYTNLCPAVPDCMADADCNDNNTCTVDTCYMPGIVNVSKCVFTPKVCTDSNKCMIPSCDPTLPGGCTSSPRPVTANTTCAGYTCDPSTGNEVFTDLCPPQPPCLNDTACNDFNACTIDSCVLNATDPLKNYCKWVDNSTNCDDHDACTIDKCDPTAQCVHTPLAWQSICNDNNACTIDTCNSSSTNLTYPCSHVPVVCNQTDICHYTQCDKLRGCLVLEVICPVSDNCTVSGCNKTDDEGCYIKHAGTCGFPVAAVVGIAAGAIAGAVVAAVAGALIVGGGAAYAFTSGAGSGLGAAVSNNPIFTPAGEKGYNPLHKVEV